MMKRQLLLLFAFLMAINLSMAMTSCGDDDEKTVTPEEPVKPEPDPDPEPEPDKDTTTVATFRCVGGDISMLTRYEQQNAQYKTHDGKAISDMIAFLKEQGWNTMRVRLFVDPSRDNDKAVIQDLAYVKALGKRIKDAGLYFMLDFHYSDTWADPAKQWTPSAWLSLSGDALNACIHDYTADCLKELVAAGATPDFIQTGNEISFGMMWGKEGTTANRCYIDSPATNWTRFINLLKQAGKACREVCPQAQIILHSERAPQPSVLTDFFDRMKTASVDYDIIGLSYYSYFHGKLPVLETALKQLEAKNYGKPIQIVEMGYPAKWNMGDKDKDYSDTYPITDEGQQKFTADLINLLKKHELVTGLLWWYPEANACGTTGDLSTEWYNGGLFDNETGRAYSALTELATFK